MPIEIISPTFTGVAVGIRVRGDDVQVKVENPAFIDTEVGFDIADAEVPAEIKTVLGLIPPGTNPAVFVQLINALRGVPEAEQAAVVSKSPFWAAVKEKTPEALALILTTAWEILKGLKP